MRQAQQNRQAKVIEAAQSALQDLGVHQTDSAPPSIQRYHHTHRDQFETRGECYSHLGAKPWGRAAKGRWAAKEVIWNLLLAGLCRSVRRYTHKEIGERVLARAKAYGLSEKQVSKAGIKNLSARSVRYRLHKYGLRSLKTGPKNSPKSDTFSQEGPKKQIYVELCSKTEEGVSTTTSSSPGSLIPEVILDSVSERFSPEKLDRGNPEKHWWGKLIPTTRFELDLPDLFYNNSDKWLLLVYGACHPGHTVRVNARGKHEDVEVLKVIRRFPHHQNGRDLTLCEFWSTTPKNGKYKKWVKVEQRDTVPQSWDKTYTTIVRDKVSEKAKMPVGTIWKDVRGPDMVDYGIENSRQFMEDYWLAMKQSRIAPWTGRVLGDVQVGGLFYGWDRGCSADKGVMEVTEVTRRCRDRQGRKVTRVMARMSSTKIHPDDHVLLSASYCKPKGGRHEPTNIAIRSGRPHPGHRLPSTLGWHGASGTLQGFQAACKRTDGGGRNPLTGEQRDQEAALADPVLPRWSDCAGQTPTGIRDGLRAADVGPWTRLAQRLQDALNDFTGRPVCPSGDGGPVLHLRRAGEPVSLKGETRWS